MTKELQKLIFQACQKKTNFFGPNAWEHIKLVVKYAKILAGKLKADKEIVETAAWLHDYASITKKEWYLDHHIHGVRLAEEVLKQFNYPKEKIERVKHCIYSHRASKKIPRQSLEAKVLASADSMAHFDHLHGLFYLAFKIRKMDLEESKRWVLAKLERSWKKLMPEAKEIVRGKYRAVKILLEI